MLSLVSSRELNESRTRATAIPHSEHCTNEARECNRVAATTGGRGGGGGGYDDDGGDTVCKPATYVRTHHPLQLAVSIEDAQRAAMQLHGPDR